MTFKIKEFLIGYEQIWNFQLIFYYPFMYDIILCAPMCWTICIFYSKCESAYMLLETNKLLP